MEKEKIGIVGQGFVGSAVKEGMQGYYDVLAYDKDPSKTSTASGIAEIVQNAAVVFLCVPTPMKRSGECDLRIIYAAMEEIQAEAVKAGKKTIVVLKSTVPPGTVDSLNVKYPEVVTVFNPEFLTEANAVNDYKNQNRIIIGGERPYTSTVKRIFAKAFPEVPIIKTSAAIAEMVKYVTNTFLTVKVSYANELYQICNAVGIDYDKVIEYAKYDNRLGQSHWSVPGPDGDMGYGGHCFPKDLAALTYVAEQNGVDTTVLTAAKAKNDLVRQNKDWESQVGRAVSED